MSRERSEVKGQLNVTGSQHPTGLHAGPSFGGIYGFIERREPKLLSSAWESEFALQSESTCWLEDLFLM